MAEDRRYYWVKLDYRRFEHDGDLDYLMGQKDGAQYVVLYMMLCLQTRNSGGELITKLGDVVIPYDVDRIVRDCKYFSRDTVMVALELYKRLGLIYVNDGGFLQISNFESVVGSECSSAKRVRELRKRKAEAELPSPDHVTLPLHCNTDVTQDIRDKREEIRDKSIEEDVEDSLRSSSSSFCTEPSTEDPVPKAPPLLTIPTNVNGKEYPVTQAFVDEMSELYPAVDAMAALRAMRGWALSNPTKRKTYKGMPRFINSWLAKEQDKGGKSRVDSVRRNPMARDYTGQYDGDDWEVV